ncbi:MAG: hypothetical protein ACREXY_28735, partial [Gammaproteobacteria bacterium]
MATLRGRNARTEWTESSGLGGRFAPEQLDGIAGIRTPFLRITPHVETCQHDDLFLIYRKHNAVGETVD